MFTIHRSQSNPILSPDLDHPWEAEATFNGCPIKIGSTTHLFYRAMSRPELLAEPHISRSVIGMATRIGSGEFKNRKPFIVPEQEYEKFGCEDPRITKFEGRYYIFYTALSDYPYGPDNIKVALAISDDLEKISEKHLVTPFNAKAMSLFPKRINGKIYAMLTVDTDRPNTKIAIVAFNKIDDIWSEDFWNNWYQKIDDYTLNIPHTDNEQVEIGSPPILTKDGWLMIYSHIQEYRSGTPIFGIQAILLDAENPRKIIGNMNRPFMVPEMFYEKIGTVSRIIFPTGAIVSGKNLEIYYGGSDTHCCTANINLDLLLATVRNEKKKLVKRYKDNPILTARKNVSWEGHGVFNPAAIDINKTIHILYRAMSDDDTSTVGYASSRDGFKITERLNKPIYIPRGEYENKQQPGNSGCEDPRIVLINETLYIFYTAYDGHVPRIASSSISKLDFLNKSWDKWSEPVLITPPSITNKDGCIIPSKTKAGYLMLHRVENSICGDYLKSLDFSKDKVNKCIEILSPRRGMWDGVKVGIAAPAIKTKKGWLLFYHGVSHQSVYSVGAVLLDPKDPTIVLARSALPIFEPEMDYEKNGVISNVVFPCGIVPKGDNLFIYYGGADNVVGVATAKISEILKTLS